MSHKLNAIRAAQVAAVLSTQTGAKTGVLTVVSYQCAMDALGVPGTLVFSDGITVQFTQTHRPVLSAVQAAAFTAWRKDGSGMNVKFVPGLKG